MTTMTEHVITPLELLPRWPGERPLVALRSGPGSERWSRWSIVAQPRAWFTNNGRSSVAGDVPPMLAAVDFTHDPLVDLDRVLAATRAAPEPRDDLPFRGGWIGWISHELGSVIEPRAALASPETAACPRRSPLIEMAWCPDALVHDNITNQWHAVGSIDVDAIMAGSAVDDAFSTGPLRSDRRPDEYRRAVERTLAYIAAGDIYQANIARWCRATFDGSTRGLARQALRSSGAWYGAYLELPGDQAVISMSPELFLSYEPTSRRVITRPIKGTRPSTHAAGELAASGKDAAELNMIVDLLRNDLGRVCDIGSVRVIEARRIETHGTVHHGVAEIIGRLPPRTTIGSLLRATFPGGSVTGVPKIRAMQIIDELERRPRGPYCGAIGFISNDGAAQFNIAIRTMMLVGARTSGRWDRLRGSLHYAAGCGIVADSDPHAELQESLDKTVALREALKVERSGSSSLGSSDPAWRDEAHALMP